jgi:flagellar hook assembly protein FlgD
MQNTPNPFNPTTAIRFVVPEGGARVALRVYDVEGRLVRTLVDGHRPAGSQAAVWDGASDSGVASASGVYFYRLEAPGFTQTRKMVLLK